MVILAIHGESQTLEFSRCRIHFKHFRIYNIPAVECRGDRKEIILRDVESNIQTKFIEQLKHMIGTDYL